MNERIVIGTMIRLVTLGEILVEIMADERGSGFAEPLNFAGPFASGAPAIFIDQAAKLDQPAAIIGCVGDDDFGALNIGRLRRDGVDVSGVAIHPEFPTGTAFVRYNLDGGRDFILNIAHSAAGQIAMTDSGRALLRKAGHLHIMGSSLASPILAREIMQAMHAVKRRGGTVSFDPNMRDEPSRERREMFRAILPHTNIFLPSSEELTRLTEARDETDAIAEILGLGTSCIVLKRGAHGASYHDRERSLAVPGFPVQEIDPTGAGDCFGAAFVVCRLQGRSVDESLVYANASGACAVRVRGPMEGTSSFAELDAFIATRRRAT